MKKILLLIAVIWLALSCKAQTPLFPNTTKLRQYNNQWVGNDPYRAFAQLRLNTLLNGVIDWIDSARASGGEGGVSGIDTLIVLNDSTIRYFKDGSPRSVTIKGVYDGRRKTDTLYKSNDSTLRVFFNGQPTDIFIGTSVEGATRGYVDSLFNTIPPTAIFIGNGLKGLNSLTDPIEVDEDIVALKTDLPLYSDSISHTGDSIRLWRNGVHILSIPDETGSAAIDSVTKVADSFRIWNGGSYTALKDSLGAGGTGIPEVNRGSLLTGNGDDIPLNADTSAGKLASQYMIKSVTVVQGVGIAVQEVVDGNGNKTYQIVNTGSPGSNPWGAYLITGLVSDVVVPGSGSTVTGTNNTPILQAAINAAADGQPIIVPPGNYGFFTPIDTLKGPKSVHLIILGNTYHNGSDFIIMANAGGLTENHIIEHLGDCIGRVNSPSFTLTNYTNGTGPQWATYTGVPFKFYNSNQHQVKFNKVAGFKTPVEAIGWDYDGAGRGLEEAYIEGREVRDCAVGIILTSINGRSFVDKVYYTGWGGGLVTVRAGLGIKIDGYSGAAPNGEVYNGAFRSCVFDMLIERCDSIAECHGDITEPLFNVTVEGSAVHSAVGWRMRSVTPNYVRDPVYTGRGVFGYDWIQQGMGLNAQGFVPVWNSSAGRRYANFWKTDNNGNVIFIGSTLTKAQRDASPSAFLYAPGNEAEVYKTITASTYTAAPGEIILFNNASATMTLPTASSNIGRRITVMNIHASAALTISNATTYTSVPASDNMTWISDGVGWRGIVNAEGTGGGGGSSQWTDHANGIYYTGNSGFGIVPRSAAWGAFAANTTTKASINIAGGTLRTTPNNGDIEFDNDFLYMTANSIRKRFLWMPASGVSEGDILVADSDGEMAAKRLPYEVPFSFSSPFVIAGTTPVSILGGLQSIPGPLQIGDVVEAHGFGTTQGGNTLNFILTIGGTSITLNPENLSGSTTLRQFEYFVRFVPTALGTSGSGTVMAWVQVVGEDRAAYTQANVAMNTVAPSLNVVWDFVLGSNWGATAQHSDIIIKRP